MTRARDSGRARPHPNRVDHAGFQHGEAVVPVAGNGSVPRVPPRVAAPARPRQAGAAPSRQGSGVRSAYLQACPIIVSQTTSEKEMNHETATMVPQLPDAAADAPSVPAAARDVVGRR
jgi:hypothetical protein